MPEPGRFKLPRSRFRKRDFLSYSEDEEEDAPKKAIHVAVKHYLESVEALKKPNTLRKYKAVLDRYVEFLPPNADPRKITRDEPISPVAK